MTSGTRAPKRARSTLKYHTWTMLYPIRIHWIIDCTKQILLSHLRQLWPAKRKDKSDDKSPPTISDSRLQGDDDSAITSETSWQAKKSSHH